MMGVPALRLRPAADPLVYPPFRGWTYKDAADAVRALVPPDYEERKDYAEGRHWRGGKGWVGPVPSEMASNRAEVMRAIERQFAPYNACGEVISAIEDAFSIEAQIGYAPLVPNDDEIPPEVERVGEEAIRLLGELWDRVQLHEKLKPAIGSAAWADRAFLRWWIPPARAIRSTDSDGREFAILPRAASPEEAAEWLALSRPTPESAAIVTDEPTQERAAVFLDEIKEGDRTLKRAVVAFAEGDHTIWRTLYENDAGEPEEMQQRTGGVLPIAEMRGENLLTASVIATQKQLNYAESLVTRTVEAAGFPERYIGNAEPTGTWELVGERVPVGPVREFNGELYQLRPEPRTLGASVTTELVGLVTDTGDNGKQARATPSVTRFEPTDPEFAIRVGQYARAKILRLCRQGHRAGESTAEASGFAYIQNRAAFEKDLENRKGAAEGALRDLLTAALGLIEGLTGAPGYFTERIRITVDMHVDAGPRSSEERAQDREDVTASLLSPETAMARGGVEDIAGELDRIGSGPRARLALLAEVAKVFGELVQATSEDAAVRALIAAGVDEELANALRGMDTDGGGEL